MMLLTGILKLDNPLIIELLDLFLAAYETDNQFRRLAEKNSFRQETFPEDAEDREDFYIKTMERAARQGVLSAMLDYAIEDPRVKGLRSQFEDIKDRIELSNQSNSNNGTTKAPLNSKESVKQLLQTVMPEFIKWYGVTNEGLEKFTVYKKIHDCLHTLPSVWERLLVVPEQNVRTAQFDIFRVEDMVVKICTDHNVSIPTSHLVEAHSNCERYIELTKDDQILPARALMFQLRNCLNNFLLREWSRINDRMIEATKFFYISDLIQTAKTVLIHTGNEYSEHKLDEIRRIYKQIETLTQEHSILQDCDLEIRRWYSSNPHEDDEDLYVLRASSLPRLTIPLKHILRDDSIHTNDNSLDNLNRMLDDIDVAIERNDLKHAMSLFTEVRHVFNMWFSKIDIKLLKTVEELSTECKTLAELIDQVANEY